MEKKSHKLRDETHTLCGLMTYEGQQLADEPTCRMCADLCADDGKALGTDTAAFDAVIKAGTRFRAVAKDLGELFSQIRPAVKHLKDEVFRVAKGDAGIEVTLSGEMLRPVTGDGGRFFRGDWKAFIKFAFGCTPRRINQLLDLEDAEKQKKWGERRQAARREAAAPHDPGVAEEVIEPKAENEPNAQAEARATKTKVKGMELHGAQLFPKGTVTRAVLEINGDESAVFQEVAEEDDGGVEVRVYNDGEPDVLPDPVPEPVPVKYDRKDPYWHFSQFKDDPQTLSTEISGMLLDFGLDLAVIKKVLRAAEKDAAMTLCQVKEAAA